MRVWPYAIVALLASVGGPLSAEEENEWEAERIHSILPLYTFDWEDLWPRSYMAPDIIAGCESRVAFGDWQFLPASEDEYGEPFWIRVSNYGAFHCAANLRSAEAREDLSEGFFARGLFAKIGSARRDGDKWELWVLQQGFVPGSDYLLLARQPDTEDATVGEFSVLQRRCPKANIRESKGMDIWTTRYCLIDSREAMLALAKRMLREPMLGTLVKTQNEERPDTVPDLSAEMEDAEKALESMR